MFLGYISDALDRSANKNLRINHFSGRLLVILQASNRLKMLFHYVLMPIVKLSVTFCINAILVEPKTHSAPKYRSLAIIQGDRK